MIIMNFEFVEFYPARSIKKTSKFLGTLHIYVCDWNADIRGICVFKGTREGFFFKMPTNRTVDNEGKKVEYPIVNFVGEKDKKDLVAFLRKEAAAEILKIAAAASV